MTKRIQDGKGSPTTYEDVFFRIGESGAENLKWLLQFSQAKLKELGLRERVCMMENVHAFCLLSGSTPAAVYRKEQVRNFDVAAEAEPATFNKRFREIESLQTIVLEALACCVDRRPLRFPAIKMEMDIDFSQWGRNDSRPSSAPFWITPPTRIDEEFFPAFIYRIACILSVDGDRIGKCQSEACTRGMRLFIRTKSDQQFCSNTCRSREAMKRKRLIDSQVKQSSRREAPVEKSGDGNHSPTSKRRSHGKKR
ncbi:MAG: hypothetical protein HRU82_03455 [Nitrospira sp.]|nr:MAG: hypothetical protein HRU82_03455 [Nitrospira sp.]